MNSITTQVQSFVTSWGSQISPYIQKRVIKRIGFGDDVEQIIKEEIEDILDKHNEQSDEAYEIFSQCEVIYNSLNQ